MIDPPAGPAVTPNRATAASARSDRQLPDPIGSFGQPTVEPTITCYRDAVGLALELADRHAFASAIALLDANGRRIDLAVARGLGPSLEPVVAWARGRAGWSGSPTGALAVSVQPLAPGVIREVDLHRFRQANWSLAAAGCRLVDWIETDGDVVRSYAYLTCPAAAWPDDPPHHRRADGAPG